MVRHSVILGISVTTKRFMKMVMYRGRSELLHRQKLNPPLKAPRTLLLPTMFLIQPPLKVRRPSHAVVLCHKFKLAYLTQGLIKSTLCLRAQIQKDVPAEKIEYTNRRPDAGLDEKCMQTFEVRQFVHGNSTRCSRRLMGPA